jgi:hypothetical protein
MKCMLRNMDYGTHTIILLMLWMNLQVVVLFETISKMKQTEVIRIKLFLKHFAINLILQELEQDMLRWRECDDMLFFQLIPLLKSLLKTI